MRGNKQSALPVCRMGWTGNMSDCNAGWIRNRELAGDRGITLDKITERRCYRCMKLAGSKVVDVVGPMCWQFYLTLSICHFIFGCRFARSVTRGKERLWINWAALLSPRCRIEVTASTQLLPVLSPWAVLPQSPLRASTQM